MPASITSGGREGSLISISINSWYQKCIIRCWREQEASLYSANDYGYPSTFPDSPWITGNPETINRDEQEVWLSNKWLKP